MLTSLLMTIVSAYGVCQANPVICGNQSWAPASATVAAANPASTCSGQTVGVVLNDTTTTITYGTGWCASGGASCTSNKPNACISLAAKIATIDGISSAVCDPSLFRVTVKADPTRTTFFKLTTSTAGCVAVANPPVGQVQIGTSKIIDGGDGSFTFTKIDGTTAAQVGATAFSGLITATGGVKTTLPMLALGSFRFCGNGSNGTTAWYDGAVSLSATYAANYETGGAACNANDSATEATADQVYFQYATIKVVGMACNTQAGGSTGVNTFKLRDDTADVTGVTCSVTNDGSLPKTCSVLLSSPVTVAAGSAMAIKNTQSNADDMSAKAMECMVFYTF